MCCCEDVNKQTKTDLGALLFIQSGTELGLEQAKPTLLVGGLTVLLVGGLTALLVGGLTVSGVWRL